MNEKFRRWLDGETDVMADMLEADERPDTSREEIKRTVRRIRRRVDRSEKTQALRPSSAVVIRLVLSKT